MKWLVDVRQVLRGELSFRPVLAYIRQHLSQKLVLLSPIPAYIRQHLTWKLFISHLVVVLVGVLVMAGTEELHAPIALNRNIAHIEAALGNDPALIEDLYSGFYTAVNEILGLAALATLLAALLISIFVAGRIVGPIRQMITVSQRIAAGDYHSRVQVLGNDELGDLAKDLNRMAATLEQTEQLRLELIGNVSHELRTPLSSIRSIMEGLVDDVLPAEPATFMRVQREVARLQRLVDDLQELSRAEAGQIPISPQPISPAELINTAAERLMPQYNDKDVALCLDLPAGLPLVQADVDRITQVLLNLMGNALHYTPSGGQVSVCAWPDDQAVFISVQDTGVGIAAEHLPHVFERFYRVDRSRSRVGGGSGIGLTIAKYLIEAHGGDIWAESAGAGQGSTFIFTLPYAS